MFCNSIIRPLVHLFILTSLFVTLAILLRKLLLYGSLGYVDSNTLVLFITVLRLALLYLQLYGDFSLLFSEQSGIVTGSSAGAETGSTGPVSAASSNVTPSVDSSENIDKPWINLKIDRDQNSFYVTDEAEKSGNNLIKQVQLQAGQKMEIISIKQGNGLKLDIDGSTKPSRLIFQGKKYEGYYVDLKFSNATITSRNLPIQRNDDGLIFIISKMISRR